MPGGMATFNVEDGFTEALVRGFSLGFITEAEFSHIAQCDNLEDVKLNLQETDYGNFLQNDASPLSPATIRDRAQEKLVQEFRYLRYHASGDLAQFLDFIVIDYMIDNVMLILKATLNNPNIVISDIVDQAHPLGQFKPSTLKSICAFENSPKGYAELYSTVLVDTPMGKYFAEFLRMESDKAATGGAEVRNLLEEMPTTKLENTLRKLYLEDFYDFCRGLGGDSRENMCALLQARADAMAINITLNSFNTTLNEPTMRKDRRDLLPSFGLLYPHGTDLLANADSEEMLVQVLRPFKDYSEILDKSVTEETSIDDAFYLHETMMCELAMEGQFSYAVYYAYVRLREQEIRNLTWACETICQKQKSRMSQHYIPLFSRSQPWRNPRMQGGGGGARRQQVAVD